MAEMTGLDLSGRRLVVTGVLTRASIAFAVARRAQELGAEVVLTSFGRRMRMTERAAGALPTPTPTVTLDVTSGEDLAELPARVAHHVPAVDGVLHSIAFAPEEAMNGNFIETEPEAATATFETSAYSLEALVAALMPLMTRASAGASVVALDHDASEAWPGYDWMGVAKAALAGVATELAGRLAPDGIRVNLVAAGPVSTPAAGACFTFDASLRLWERAAPLGWSDDSQDALADAACFLLSPWSAGITGQRVHVDGGLHALGPRVGDWSVAR